MTTWTIIDYFDVWGNAEDGWEVNNQCEICNDLNITDDAGEMYDTEQLETTGSHMRPYVP